MKEIVAELSQLARRSSEVSQRSGVSVRVTIANHETLVAAALKRAVRLGEPIAAPRDQRPAGAIVASTAGKIELETLGDETREEKVDREARAARRRQRLQPPLRALRAASAWSSASRRRGARSRSATVASSAAADGRRAAGAEPAVGRLDVGESPAGRRQRRSSSCSRGCTSTAA